MGSHSFRNGRLAVAFHDRFPIIVRFGVGESVIEGDSQEEEPAYTVCSPEHGRNELSSDAGLRTDYEVRQQASGMAYTVTLSKAGRPVVRLDLVYTLDESGVVLAVRGVEENQGYQLVHVDLKHLVSASTADPLSRLILPTHGGRRIDPSRCGCAERVHRYNWVRDSFCRVGLVSTARASVILHLESLNDFLLSHVSDVRAGRRAGIGVRIVHRLEARQPRLQFAVHSPSRVRFHLMDTDRADPLTAWVPAARRLHELVRNAHPDIYAGRFIHKVFVGNPGSPAEVPFETVLRGIRRRFHLFDGAAQVCYLVGFQHEGHDSGYPHVFTVNSAAGGADTLLRIMKEARAYNATISFHDNSDDAYRSSPDWDPADIALDPGGELLKGGVWNGSQAWWISLPKYVRDKAEARLRRTRAMYPIPETYHLDVLTASVFRPDFDPAAPSDRNDDCAARKQLATLFRAHGIDVTTEGCGLPFLDTFRYFWDLPRPAAAVFEGDEPIPLAPFIAHGTVGYGGSEADRYGVVEGLYSGAFHSKDFTWRTPESEMLDAFYLLQRPLDLLRGRAMIDYEERGATRLITYDDGSTVEVDFERLTHRVTVAGCIVVEDFVSFAPGPKPGTSLLYLSRLQEMGTRMGPCAWPCPAAWRGRRNLRATALTPDGDGETRTLAVSDEGTFGIDVEAGVPYRVRVEGEG
jgi:hypothetical protein